MADSFELVGQYPTLVIAELVKTTLAAAGIPAFFENAEVVQQDWMLGNAVGQVKVLVPSPFYEQAMQVLDGCRLNREERLREKNEDPGAADRCLACDAEFPQDMDACPACGWTYAGGELEPFDEDD
ncbi:MAG: hypothetical protein KDA69_03175 [Planctomycetaceae bacterium]|nr:hypothetical protein [Planctomycetaceae bacterium]